MNEEISYGWAGKILRVNLTTGEITTEPTKPYERDYIGGMGLANKLLFDDVPSGTDPYAPENELIFAVGPLTASGVPSSGKMCVTTLSTFTKGHMVVDGHCGGMIAARVKQAGYDAIVLEGKAEKPVYVNIVDDQVEIKDAADVWGLGTRKATEILTEREGTEACVALIGPAGENLLPYSCIINSRKHSAGAGTGAVMGSKNCKALVVQGTGHVNIKDPEEFAHLCDYFATELASSCQMCVVPDEPQDWAEYYDEESMWKAKPGLTWGAAEGGPRELGVCPPGEVNKIGLRSERAVRDWGEAAEQYSVKAGGCYGCLYHCKVDANIPELEERFGSYAITGNCCAPNLAFKNMEPFLKTGITESKDTIFWHALGCNLVDDLGLWDGYVEMYRAIAWCYATGVFERVLPAEEYASFDWDKFYRNDPTILTDLFTAIARNDSELAYVGHGPIVWCERWDCMDWFDNPQSQLISKLGYCEHHGPKNGGSTAFAYNTLKNRDSMNHALQNFVNCGLPIEVKKELAAEIWGSPDAVDPAKHYTPINESKARFAWWAVVRDNLVNSLTLCGWVWPVSASPLKERGYRGDLDLEAKFMTAVTGEEWTTEELEKAGARIMTLQRAGEVRDMGTMDMRNEHDAPTEWSFTRDPEKNAFDDGTVKSDRDDVQKAFSMIYEQLKWDSESGAPTAESYDYYGMEDVKEKMLALGLA